MSEGTPGESIAEQLSGTLWRIRQTMTAVENACQVDNDMDGYDGAITAAADLVHAAEALRSRLSAEYARAEEADDDDA